MLERFLILEFTRIEHESSPIVSFSVVVLRLIQLLLQCVVELVDHELSLLEHCLLLFDALFNAVGHFGSQRIRKIGFWG